MANYALSATQAIVDYLWSNLTTTNSNVTAGKILEADDYQADLLNGPVLNIIPIFPAQQDMINYQELGTKTHIVYDHVADGYEENWMICRDSMMFTTYSQDFNKIAEIQNLMLDLFRRMDESARDINASLPAGSPFIFFSVSLADLLSPEPQREKNGWFAGQVVIRYKYGRQVNSSGRFA
jgi:hypothetical protein